MDTRAGQLAGVVVGGDVQAVVLRDHLDGALATSDVDGPFEVGTAVILQPQVNGNSHVKLLISS
ncbi:hypothetical protein D3C80_2138890 [compost metagenome]